MFDIYLYKFAKHADSTKRPEPSAGYLVRAVTNSPLDAMRPTVALNLGRDSVPSSYNYMRIPALNRYYFIDNWSFSEGLWYAACHEDELATWRDTIGASEQYVVRSAADYDGSIIDTLYPAKTNYVTETCTITSPWDLGPGNRPAQGSYILGTIGSRGFTNYTWCSLGDILRFSEYIMGDTFFEAVRGSDTGIYKSQFNPMQYVSKIQQLPVASPTGEDSLVHISMGWWPTPFRFHPAPNSIELSRIINIPKHPQSATRGQYLNCPPYAEYVLDARPFGRISLDPSLLLDNNTIQLNISVDPISGTGTLTVLSGGARIAYTAAQCSVPVQLSQIAIDWVSAGLSVFSAGVAYTTGNTVGAAAGIADAVASTFPTATVTGVDGGFANMMGDWHLIGKFATLTAEDLEHRGRPLMQRRRLGTLPGYQVIADADLEAPATAEELQTITGKLEAGYYYE